MAILQRGLGQGPFSDNNRAGPFKFAMDEVQTGMVLMSQI
jgi:hypothetical protein